ncbi:MAG: TlpA family protein disulfide reductase [Cypionkella sp.]
MNRRVFLKSTAALALTAGTAAARAPFALYDTPLPLVSPPLQNSIGRTLRLDSFAGRLILVNVWATWCAPCREEIPALDRLQAQLGGKGFAVVPVSIDEGGIDAARQFYSDFGITNLDLYWGQDLRVKLAFAVYGLPTSLLINRNGLEIGRVSGPARWDGAGSIEQLSQLIGQA